MFYVKLKCSPLSGENMFYAKLWVTVKTDVLFFFSIKIMKKSLPQEASLQGPHHHPHGVYDNAHRSPAGYDAGAARCTVVESILWRGAVK